MSVGTLAAAPSRAHAMPRLPTAPRRVTLAVVAAVALAAATVTLTGGATPTASFDRATGSTPAAAVAVVDPGIDVSSPAAVRVVVRAHPGRTAEATAAVRAAGGTTGEALPLIDGVAATLPATGVPDLARSPAVHSVTLDRSASFEELSYDSGTTASMFARTSGATDAWSRGVQGEGVGVAIIDTGVSSMNDVAGRMVFGPDLSGEGTTVDSYGHGSVMAGVIAGSGADSAGASTGPRTGVAPKARVVSVKVAGRNGSVDVSTMLQAMHWVSAYKDQFGIRVLNLSWGTPSTQSPAVDPLNYAVQRLWRQGIVVVVAAGNSGPGSGTITKPGDDPLALTVGGYDDKQNTDPTDDSIPAWTSRGPTAAGLSKPDVVAPGRSLVSMRSFGSKVEQDNPKALIAPSYIRGSGSSQATAVTSGLVALLLAADPSLTPDQVKATLKGTAAPVAGAPAESQGAGRVRLGAALSAAPGPAAWQDASASGLGSIEASRGGRYVAADCHADGDLDVITGEIDVRCEAWDPHAWTGTSWTGTSWTGTSWTSGAWSSASWSGTSWTGGTWTGGSWQGTSWTGTSWTGTSWTGTSWTGTSWTGTSWTGTSWTGTSWTGGAYEEEETGEGTFLTAFWGDPPRPSPARGRR